MRKFVHSSRILRVFKNPSTLIFILILVAGIFFRFYNTPDRFGFDKDPTRDAIISLYGSRHLQFPLTGPHSGIAPFTFGPWYYYQLIFFQFVFPVLYAPFYYIALFSLSFIILMYFIGKELKDRTLGLILAGFAALSPSQTGPSAGLSNPNLVSPHAAITLLFFILFLKKNRPLWFSFLWGLELGIGINNHFQMIPLIILPLIAYSINWKNSLKDFFTFVGGVFVSFIPFLIFNILTNWHTVRGLLEYLQSDGGNYIPNSWRIYLFDFWPRFWAYLFGAPQIIGVLFVLIVVSVNIYLLIKKKLPIVYVVLMAVLGFFFLLLRYYNGQRDYYYLFFLQPFLFLFAGMALWFLWQSKVGKVGLGLIIMTLLFFTLPQDMLRLSDREELFLVRKQKNELVKKFPHDTFTIYHCGNGVEIPEGVAYFLSYDKLLNPNGRKIAFAINAHCPLPAGRRIKKLSGEFMYEFRNISDRELKQTGWVSISPESVYAETVDWWKK